MMLATYQKLTDASWTLCGNSNKTSSEVEALSSDDPKERARRTREEAAKSKSGTWGPTHSFDSEEEVREEQKIGSGWISGDGWWPSSSATSKGASAALATPPKPPSDLKRSTGTDSTRSSASSPKEAHPPLAEHVSPSSWGPWPSCHIDTTVKEVEEKTIGDYVEDVCTSPCQPRNLDVNGLGITRMEPPDVRSVDSSSPLPATSNSSVGPSASGSVETAAERRRQRHKRRQKSNGPSPHDDFEVTQTQVLQVAPQKEEIGSQTPPTSKANAAPLDSFTLDQESAVALERQISELTMRSSYGVATVKISENRRMAYYAVGKHHRQSGRGGNRRCYFTGKLILGGAPFYAGSVQQGLRTLVVFCLPSSLGLPREGSNHRESASVLSGLGGGSVARRGSGNKQQGGRSGILSRKGSRISKMSSMDEMSLSVGEELDPNWGLDKDYLLSVLPNPKQALLDEMARRFPQQFETLPVQVRTPQCWRLYVKFCFFSGLPIAEGELHYRVRDEVADTFGEEVVLSHEVMEAVNGQDSAEILRLPNQKTFRYLQKHYHQQSAKLPEEVFERQSWEMVRPEV